MPSRRDRDRKGKGQRQTALVSAAEDLLPAVMRSLLRAGMAPDALKEVVDRTIAEIREEPARYADGKPVRQDLDDLAHVLSIWHSDPRFLDRTGAPRKLRQAGRAPSFESLAKAAIPSLAASEALQQLLLAGVVDVDSRQRVRALRRELVICQWDELGIWNWRHAVRRHLETLECNYSAQGDGRFERTARSERLPASSLPLFKQWLYEQGGNFVRMVDDWLTQHERPDSAIEDENEDVVTAGVGVYLFVDEPGRRP